jgi:hypothetical protein
MPGAKDLRRPTAPPRLNATRKRSNRFKSFGRLEARNPRAKLLNVMWPLYTKTHGAPRSTGPPLSCFAQPCLDSNSTNAPQDQIQLSNDARAKERGFTIFLVRKSMREAISLAHLGAKSWCWNLSKLSPGNTCPTKLVALPNQARIQP